MSFVVLVDCGYSEWFEARDMRVYGPFESEQEAVIWASNQEAAEIPARNGGFVKIVPMVLAEPPERIEV